jgi:flavin reductase (DIM6/NTAB) family NADH-FMN oxidoreductase RutF
MELRHDMLTHGVYVVAAEHEGKHGGLAVAWATQVGKDRILICIGQQSYTRELILASKAFGMSALTKEQLPIARTFGSHSSRKVDKFAGISFHAAQTGSPLLDDCAAWWDCRVMATYDLGTQKLIVGQIVAAERLKQEYEPLIYREEDY